MIPGAGGFVGRGEETAAVLSALLDSGSAGAVVSGEAGSGKTALTRQVLHRLEGRMRCFPVHASRALAAVPYGALAPHLGRPASDDDAVAVMRRLTDHFHRGSREDPAGREHRRDGQVLLVVENAQDLDADSSYVISHLVMSGAVRALVLNRRSGRRSQEPGCLGSDGLLRQVRLPQLTQAQVHELCSLALSGPVARGTSGFIAEAAAGNPLFVRALLAWGRRQHALVRRNGVWVFVDEAPAPDTRIQDLVRSLAAERPAGEQAVLELLALAGGLPYAALRRLADEADVANLLDEGILDRTADGAPRIYLRSPVFADVLAASVPYGRSTAIRRRAAAACGTESWNGAVPARYLEWGLECGDVSSPGELLAAARKANGQHRPRRALRLARAVADPAFSAASGVQQARAL
ncbi:AAA family ATPase, partial [Arthrobacter sp. GCM10027362]|uniref:AAA family ATPase n=1 Tax=Arthrobacter sp. GCM10027362 TaxID=3273379 RepID=UPI003643664E